jgi:triosephosphate isomerase
MFNETKIKIGAQRCSPHMHGAFTGQDPAQSVNEIGCSHCIIGHSEARKEFRLSDEQVAQKFVHLLDYDITPIVCIGGTKEEFDAQNTLAILERQLDPILEAIKTKTVIHDYIIPYIAYEPIWSIGTGEVASNEHLDMVFCWIAEKIAKNVNNHQIKLMYGGSVTSENIEILRKIDKISGFLVGKASLDFQEFEKIVK